MSGRFVERIWWIDARVGLPADVARHRIVREMRSVCRQLMDTYRRKFPFPESGAYMFKSRFSLRNRVWIVRLQHVVKRPEAR